MSGIPSLTILSEEQKFNGENLLQWNMNIQQLLGSKGLLGYIDGSIKKPTTETVTTVSESAQALASTPIYSLTPTSDEWTFQDHLQVAKGHIMLNCTDVVSLSIKTNGTVKESWDSIQMEWGEKYQHEVIACPRGS